MKVKFWAGILLTAMAISACDDNTQDIGASLTKDVDHFSITADTFRVSTRSIVIDSVLSRSTYDYLGRMKDPETGDYVTADYITQFVQLEQISNNMFPTENTILGRIDGQAIADSCHLNIYIQAHVGDSLAPMKLTAYEMATPLEEGKVYYSDFNPFERGLIREDGIKKQKSYTYVNYLISESRRDESSYIPYINVTMNEPYTDSEGGNGVLYYSDEKVIDFCKEANRAGLQIEMHAIGDKAFDQATKALKAALDDHPRKDHRHGIIHDCLPTEDGIRICAEYGITMPIQSAFINWKQEPDAYLESIMGKERCARLNPIRTFLNSGIVVSFGSDAPCTSPDPIVWMDKAVNNPNPDESVSIRDALRMCTYNGYYTSFDEKERGSLEVGKIADMVILSADPYAIPSDEIGDLRVEKLILGGEDYRSAKRSVAKAFWDGMTSKSTAY